MCEELEEHSTIRSGGWLIVLSVSAPFLFSYLSFFGHYYIAGQFVPLKTKLLADITFVDQYIWTDTKNIHQYWPTIGISQLSSPSY